MKEAVAIEVGSNAVFTCEFNEPSPAAVYSIKWYSVDTSETEAEVNSGFTAAEAGDTSNELTVTGLAFDSTIRNVSMEMRTK